MEEDTHDGPEVENTGDFVEVAHCPRSEFAAVIFHNIPETYPADACVECMYTLTSDIYPSTRDYIGLYKVGWMSYRDYVYYEWAPWPELYEAGKDIECKVIFPAGKLPTEDGEFYQFCYVMKTGQIRGASMPFQFKRPCADDFIEEEDTEGDMLVIRSKTIVLEEKIKEAEEEKIKMLQTQENLERERESLISKMTELNRTLTSEQESSAYLTEQLKLSHERILQLNKEEEDMILVQDQLQLKLKQVTQLRSDLESEVKALEERIEDYKQIIKTLENQKDELAGKNKSLEQEKELYKSHVSSSESVVLNHQREVLELKTELDSCKEELKVSKVDFLAVKVALETERSELQKQSSSSSADKTRIEELQECLRNVEDKLATEENTKKMLSEEINAFVITQEKMSRSLEDSSLESDKLREKINKFELHTRSLNAIIDQLKTEKEEVVKELAAARKELGDTEEKLTRLAAAEKEVANLQEQVSCLKEQHGQAKEATEKANTASHFALQKANATLRERLERKTKHWDELQAHKDELLKKKKQQDEKMKDLVRERDDLRERIFMCSSEYKALYATNRKLEKKINRMDKFGIRSKSKDGSGDDSAPSTDTSVKPDSPGKVMGKSSLLMAALQNKIEMLTSDLEKKCAKKEKYKKLYLEEKDKQEVLRKHYYEESRKAEEEMEKLKRKNSNMKEEFDLKYRSMQNLLTKREKELDDLSRSRREVVGLLQEKERPSTQKKEDRVVTTPPKPVLMYPNPYEGVASETIVYPPQQMNVHPLAYPYPQRTATICYPAQTTPESSASCPEQPGPVVMDRSDSVHLEIDRESEASGPLDPPLVPRGGLDPPLVPTITPTAKVAAVRSAIQPDGPQCVNDDFVLTLESSMEGETIEKVPITPTVVPSAPHDVVDGEEEKYQDADGEAMKICPSCNKAFPHDVNEREFELHIVGHFGKICPLCDAQLDPNCSTEDFEKHVNDHFQD